MQGTSTVGDTVVGPSVDEYRGILKCSYPMEHGVVNNWEDMEKIWEHIYKNELKVPETEHPVLLTEAPLNPLKNREMAAEVFFEKFNVPALYVSMQAVLSLYAAGKTTGVVLDVGDGVSHSVPVFEGFALPHAITRSDVAGREVTNYFQLLLRRAGYNFHTSAEKEVVREIKEAKCYVAKNSTREKETKARQRTKYRLPDNNEIELGTEVFEAPEVLFNPELIGLEYTGVAATLVNCIQKSDLDVRKTLYQNVVLSGGSTMFRGFGARLLDEVKSLAPPQDLKIKIQAPPERKISTWLGGSILASLGTFKSLWITREEYMEEGEKSMERKLQLVHKKTF
jgi:centractin|eukprot:COSAG06_NODE_4669_length_4051_cov_2.267713_1_plen_339_part_00